MTHGKTVYRKDYQVPDYLVTSVALQFDLYDDYTMVTQQAEYTRNPEVINQPALFLHGDELELESIALDGKALAPEAYTLNDLGLTIASVPAAFSLTIITKIFPKQNKSLNGLYCSNDVYCTQCEAEGFRRMTYFPDRPDVMTVFTTTITADKAYKQLLSNGNLIEQGELDNHRHYAKWQDPFKKPCYLFALVAGDLAMVEDRFTTHSGREVSLRIFVEHGKQDKTKHAMWSLKQAMRWDEQRFGREYDLDLFMIVAVSDFNMGAMENKGLNIFNDKCILADPNTATDRDYTFVSIVVGHEYFHNWTGNRVTCRDWFQLSLKEGLTVFRDQEFSADMFSRPVRRIEQVRTLRSRQFPEDKGPMAHPVRPDSFMEINNFYTVTIYEKGAEVIRMQHTLLGEVGFRRGMDLYFERHDGQAVTCDDFVQAMADANQLDFSQFKHWYSQAGTPELRIAWQYHKAQQQFTLTVEQYCPATPGQTDKLCFHIPLKIALLNPQGQALSLQLADEDTAKTTERVLAITEAKQTFTFIKVEEAVVPSLLRGFSAPVLLQADYSIDELIFLMVHDNDEFACFEACQQLAMQLILKTMKEGFETAFAAKFSEALRQVLTAEQLDPALRAEALRLPSMADLIGHCHAIDIERLYQAREAILQYLAAQLNADFIAVYNTHHTTAAFEFTATAVAHRALKNTCLAYLARVAENHALIEQQYQTANNMTDTMAALALIAEHDTAFRQTALDGFARTWQHDPLVMDKWFSVQACADRATVLADVKQLMQHDCFDLENPNRVRALIGSFSQMNWRHFHRADGAGYEFLADVIMAIDRFNPQTASRLLQPFLSYQQYDKTRQTLIHQQLLRIREANPSKDVFEIVEKSLG